MSTTTTRSTSTRFQPIDASNATTTSTVTTTTTTTDNTNQAQSGSATTTLRLTKKKKKVIWNSDTVDNEDLGRKKSKCCCIYRKPHNFGESSSDSEQDDCDHCRGHVEKRSTM